MKVYTAYNQKTRGGACRLWEELLVKLARSPDHVLIYASPEVVRGAEHSHRRLGRVGGSALGHLVGLFFTSLFCWWPTPGSIAISQGNLYSLALLPLRWKGARLITLIHGDYAREYNVNGHPGGLRKVILKLVNMAYRKSQLILPVSEDLVRITRAQSGLPAARFKVVANGCPKIKPTTPAQRLAWREEWKVAADEFLVVFVGGLNPIKRVDVLLDAVAHIPQGKRPAVRIIGEGPLRSELEQQVDRLGIANQVVFVGALPDIRERMAAANLLVLCSDYEGCPTVLVEALANEVLVLGTRVGGIPEVIGLDGLLVPANDPAALAKKIENLCEDGDRRERLRTAWVARRACFETPWADGVLQAINTLPQ